MQTLDFDTWAHTLCPPPNEDVRPVDYESTAKFLKIIGKLPPCSRQGPWIVGGTIRRLLEHKDFTTDLDIMFKNERQYEDYCAWLRENGGQIIDESPRQCTYKYKGWEVQPIKAVFSNTIRQTLEKFDFTICQFGFDGENLIWGDNSMEHLKEKKLIYVGTSDHISSMRRAFKYANQGFFMDQDAISKFLKDAVTKQEMVEAASKGWEAEALASGGFPGRQTGPRSYGV